MKDNVNKSHVSVTNTKLGWIKILKEMLKEKDKTSMDFFFR